MAVWKFDDKWEEAVLLNGDWVKADTINPKQHKFIGMFRAPYRIPQGYVMCSCGSILQTQQTSYDHWQSGHNDVPQYTTIKESEATNEPKT